MQKLLRLAKKFLYDGNVFISVNDSDKENILKISRDFNELDYNILATSGTSQLLSENGINCNQVYKVGEGRPNIVDAIKNNEINMVINTPLGAQSRFDEYEIGKAAIKHKNSGYNNYSRCNSNASCN